MLFRRPGIHVDANLGNQAEGGSFIDSVDLSQIHAANSKRFLSSVESHQIPLSFLGTPGGLEIGAWLYPWFPEFGYAVQFAGRIPRLASGSGQRRLRIASAQTGVRFGSRPPKLSKL